MSDFNPSDRIDLKIDAGDPFTEISIIDGNLRQVDLDNNLGKVSVTLPRGIYDISFNSGDNLLYQETVILMDASQPYPTVHLPEEARRFDSAVPLARTRASDSHQLDAGALSRSPPVTPKGMRGGSRLMLYLRRQHNGGKPEQNISLLDVQGVPIYELTNVTAFSEHATGVNLDLDPGAYVIKARIARQNVQQMVYTFESWQTQVFLSQQQDGEDSLDQVDEVSIIMRRTEKGFDPADKVTELAARAIETLASEGGSLSESSISDLDPELLATIRKESPLLRLYASLLHLRKAKIDGALMLKTFNSLNELLPQHPDVLAIGWATAQSLQDTPEGERMLKKLKGMEPIKYPPMLRESWQHLLRATLDHPGLITDESPALWISDRVIERGAWLRWEGKLPETRRISWIKKLGRVVKKYAGPFVLNFAKLSLKVEIPRFVNHMAENQEIWPLVESHHFTPTERRIAIFLFPLLDPSIQRMTRKAKKLTGRMVQNALDDMPSEHDMLRALNIPIGKMMLSLSLINQKLSRRPLLASRMTIRVAMKWESQGDDEFYGALYALRRENTPFTREKGKNPVNLLELFFLRRHGTLLLPHPGPLEAKDVAFLLSNEGYTLQPGDGEISEQNVSEALKIFEQLFPLPDTYAEDEGGYDAWLDNRDPLRGKDDQG